MRWSRFLEYLRFDLRIITLAYSHSPSIEERRSRHTGLRALWNERRRVKRVWLWQLVSLTRALKWRPPGAGWLWLAMAGYGYPTESMSGCMFTISGRSPGRVGWWCWHHKAAISNTRAHTSSWQSLRPRLRVGLWMFKAWPLNLSTLMT